jgi:CheY-like chemotaxis protein
MRERILIIEDNVTNMELMEYLLRAFRFEVCAAYDGAAGINAARSMAPDLIICDVHLPKMDGYEVVREIKGTPSLNGVPVVAVTALAMVGDQEKLLDAGFDAYIGKPIDPESFVGQIDRLLHTALRSKKPAETAQDPNIESRRRT